MKLSETLRAGKARLAELGWVQGDEAAIFKRSGCCVATAIALGDDGGWDYTAIRFFLEANGLEPTSSPGAWNDAPERTLAEVNAAFDKAIAAAEAQEQSQ